MEPEPKPGHSSNRDYALAYGDRCRMNRETSDTFLKKKSGKTQGLTDRKPL